LVFICHNNRFRWQHFPKDLPKFIDKLETEKNAIIIGARNMEQESVPAKVASVISFLTFGLR
jgi:hypothetical protein